jgi:hypothetical protein
MSHLRFTFFIALLFAANAPAATVTLSQSGIIALDYRAPGPSASILHALPSQGGVEYTVSVRSRAGAVHLFSESNRGRGLLAGLPWTPGDTFGLRFTLLPTAVPGMTLAGGVVLNGARGKVGLACGQTTVDSSTATGAGGTAVEMVGFHLDFATPPHAAWPEDGAVVQVLIQPIGNATQLTPREEPSLLPDAAPGRTFTLTAPDLLALQVPSYRQANAFLVSAAPSDSGELYTIQFNDNRGALILELPANSPLLGMLSTGSDSFALKFTVKSTAPEPESVVGAGALVIDANAPVFLSATNPSGLTSDTGARAAIIRKLGVIVYIPPAGDNKWPATGGTVQILVEPAPNAVPVEDIGKGKSQ